MSAATDTRPVNGKPIDPPHSEESERAVLGALILDPSCIAAVSELLGVRDFYKPAHQRIYNTIVVLHEHGTKPDLITITEQLEQHGVLEISGGRAYIARLTDAVPSSANVTFYAGTVRGTAVERALQDLFHSVGEKIGAGGHTADELVTEAAKRLQEIQKRSAGKKHGFRIERAAALSLVRPDWLVRGLIERDQVGSVFGDPGTAKSFLMLSLSCCVATGTHWYGKDVKLGVVVYIAGEGQQGIARRIHAWAAANRVDMERALLFVALQPARLIDPDSVSEVIQAIERIAEQAGAPALIVIDTLARNFGPGDENATPDMNAVICAADSLRERWHCAVFFTHHAGHADKTRSRGNSALRGALDTEFRLDKDEQGVIRMEAMKTKDGEPPAPMAFRLRSVEIGLQDEEGTPITSAVLDVTAYEPKPEQGKAGRGKWQTMARAVLETQIEQHRANLAADGRDPDTARVSVDTWQTACREVGMDRRRFWDAKASLAKGGFIREENGYVDLY